METTWTSCVQVRGHRWMCTLLFFRWCFQNSLITSTFQTALFRCPRAKNQRPEFKCFTNYESLLYLHLKHHLQVLPKVASQASTSAAVTWWMWANMFWRPFGNVKNSFLTRVCLSRFLQRPNLRLCKKREIAIQTRDAHHLRKQSPQQKLQKNSILKILPK